MSAEVSAPTSAPPSTVVDDLDWTSGVRGVAALFVLVYHAVLTPLPDGVAGNGQLVVQLLALAGHEAVLVFVVLSGYLLGRHWNERLRPHPFGRPMLTFMIRRSWRMLPAYWVALALTIVCMLALGLDQPGHTHWDTGLPLTWTRAVVDALLVSDLTGQVVPLSHQLWTIPVEFHLYLTVPLVALCVGRASIGALACVGTVALVVIAPGWAWQFLVFAFLTSFWLGGRGGVRGAPGTTVRSVGPLIALALVQLVGVSLFGSLHQAAGRFFVTDTLMWALVLPWLHFRDTGANRGGRRPLDVRLLSTSLPVRLGLASYSFYLVHALALELTWRFMILPMHIDAVPLQVTLIIVLGLAMTLLATVPMWYLVEAPSMRQARIRGRSVKLPTAAPAAAS